MNGLTRQDWLAVIEHANRAPSPHNIQPWCWRVAGDQIELWEDTARWLHVADPTGRDNRIALGAVWEGMCIALSARKIRVTDLRLLPHERPLRNGTRRRIALGKLAPGAVPDSLGRAVESRRSFRGVFRPATTWEHERLAALLTQYPAVSAVIHQQTLGYLAELHDHATAQGIADPAFTAELYRWMRFSATDSGWTRDGLSTECLALSRIEACAARFALKPAVASFLCRIGLGKLLAAETAKTESAMAILLITAPTEEDAFITGRAFYRLWLALADIGLSAVPMSAMVDTTETRRALLERHPIPRDRQLINAFRVGPSPATATARSARLPAAETLLGIEPL